MSNVEKSEEVIYQLWDDKNGNRAEVGPDRDGLGLIEIRSYGSDAHKPEASFLFEPEDAEWFVKAILKTRTALVNSKV